MLIVALVMDVIGLAALVTAVVTSNEVIAWVCIGASVIGVVLLIIDGLGERRRRDAGEAEEPYEEPQARADKDDSGTYETDSYDEGSYDDPTYDVTYPEDSGRNP